MGKISDPSRWRAACAAAVAAGLVAGGAALAPAARAQITQEAAASRVAKDYDVKVLRVRPGDIDGAPVWLVTVMRAGGNFNTAFQVTTLAVDQASGALVPVFRHGASGATGTVESTGVRSDQRPDASRSGTWR